MNSIFEEVVKKLFDAGPLLSALPIAFAVLVQLLYKFYYTATDVRDRVRLANVAINTVKSAEPDWEVDSRLAEARRALERQEGIAAWNRRTLNALTFSQYVIGGVLASSFVQTQLAKEVVGLLGVLVLVASLIHQRYRPDVKRRNASQRVAQLRSLIRKAEDLVYEARVQKKDITAIPAIRQFVTDGLNQVEVAELDDAQPQES